MPEISIILPYFNKEIKEVELEKLKEYLSTNFLSFELIIVNDGSKNDKIFYISKKLGFLYICLKKNRGKGYAVKTGMLNARGTKRIFLDFDLPYNLESIHEISNQLNSYDVVIGDRSLKDSNYYEDVNFLKNYFSKLFSIISSRIIGSKFDDTQCGIKGFTKKSAEYLFNELKTNGFGFDVEILHLAVRNKYSIKNIPVKLVSNVTGIISYIKNGILILIDIYKIHNIYRHS